MFTIVHPAVQAGTFSATGAAVVKQLATAKDFRQYLQGDLQVAIDAACRSRDDLLSKRGVIPAALKRMQSPPTVQTGSGTGTGTGAGTGGGGGGTALDGNSDPSLLDAISTTFWEHANYQGRSKNLSNLWESINGDVNLRNDGLNDQVSSIEVGFLEICVVGFQHSWFRGAQLWCIAGMQPSKRDLSTVPFPGGGKWNDRISSVVVATVSPVDVLRWLVL